MATEIQARLLIRDTNLGRIADELLVTDNLLLPWDEFPLSYQIPGDPSLRKADLEQQARLQAEIRMQDAECWRDVASVAHSLAMLFEAAAV